ncbi:MAG TPA: peptide chain release factor 2 [Candidatus Deferrimicrobium sp.]|nr:peptide chain release factor 2 [Candidatus Kapabacteria bacterium]HLP62021.1 peptide chain release factor 2 [Candidatus Deferrimicrobium sp.]
MELIELKSKFEELKRKAGDLRKFLDLESKRRRMQEIENALTDSDTWNKPKKSAELLKEKKILGNFLEIDAQIMKGSDEIETYFSLLDEDPDLINEAEQEILAFEKLVEDAEIKNYLSGENDAGNAFLNIHPGAGGTESQDWAEMLLRMYLRFGERSKYKVEIIELMAGEEAGIKSVTVKFDGQFAYGYLKQEIGVHRLVRISPFDANKRRHTSFAAVFVYPEVDDSIDIEINPSDLRIDTYRASGKGGQHVNTTDSAVRILHVPSNIVVQCQNERSQHQNKESAMRMLKSKLYDREMREKMKEKDRLENEKGEIAWGNQIRSYVLHPYQSIKDHRTGLEIGNSQRVLDGDIFDFIKAALKRK